MFKDKKNIIILLLSILIIIMSIVIVIFLTLFNKHPKIDVSKMTSSELIEMFKQEGYEIVIYKSNNSTIYVNLENSKEGITLQRIYNIYLGNLMTFDNDSINDEMADLIDTNKNNNILKKQQYEAYESWLKKYNITIFQISEMLDKYYSDNKDKATDLDVLINNLL